MKTLLLILLSFTAFSQDKVYRVHKNNEDTLTLIRYPYSKTITVRAGSTYKYTIPDPDTARFFQSETGEQLVATITYSKPGGGTTEPPPPDPVIVEQIVDAADNVAGVTFSGNWSKGPTNASGWYKNTIAYSSAVGATVSFTFTGRKIEVYGETLLNHGTGSVQVYDKDGKLEVDASVTYKSVTKVLPAKIFERSWPTDGKHTVTVKVGTGNSLVDYFKYYSVQ